MIETKRLIIRTFRQEDADALYRIKTDPQVIEFCPDFLDVDAKREDMPGYIREFQRIEDTGTTIHGVAMPLKIRKPVLLWGRLLSANNRCSMNMNWDG